MRKRYTEKKLFKIAQYMIDNNATLLETGKKFELSEVSIYRYMNLLLPEISLTLHKKVRKVIEHNISIRATRANKVMISNKAMRKNLRETNIGGWDDGNKHRIKGFKR